jgi:hypothetical protein
MSSLETQARLAWQRWGPYAKFTFCALCGLQRYCRGKRNGRMLCLECWDTEES